MTGGLNQGRTGRTDVLSPYGLALLSFMFFALVWLIPPSVYTKYLDERDLLFLDPASMLLYAACAGSFMIGVGIVDIFLPSSFAPVSRINTRISGAAFLLVPIIVGAVFTLMSIRLLLQGNPALVALIMLQQGAQIKDTLDVRQPLGLSSIWLLGICWWAMWRYHQIEFQRRWLRWTVILSIALAILLVIVSASLKLARGELIPVVAGCALLYLIQRVAARQLTARNLGSVAVGIGVGIVTLFYLVSLARGSDDAGAFLRALLGYTASSYNRLAAIVNGRLHYPYTGTGLYVSPFVSFNTSFNNLLPISELMHWPSYLDMWDSQFAATCQAGLDGSRIWSGAFGYIFADLGWFAPVLVFAYGLIYGWVWRSLKLGRISGIILYPWCGFCVLFWFGANSLLATELVVFLLLALVLSGYERLVVSTGSGAG